MDMHTMCLRQTFQITRQPSCNHILVNNVMYYPDMQDEFLCFGKKWQRTVNVMWITSPTQCEHKAWPLQSTEPSSSGSRWAPWWGFCISVTLLFRPPSCTQLNLSNRAIDYVTAAEWRKAPLPQRSQPCNYRSHELWLIFVVPFSLKLSTPLCQPPSHLK